MPAPIKLANGQRLRPLTARSIILSTLLGADDAAASASELVLVAREFAITETALRAALSRMFSGGDLERDAGRYRLTSRLVARQHRQDEAVHPVASTWDGTWQVAVVTAAGRSAADRVEHRNLLYQAKLSELREGVWMRPANLPPHLGPRADILGLAGARPTTSDADLVAQLWDLPTWAAIAGHLIEDYIAAPTPATRFPVAAAIVRHLLDDPALPSSLVPADYPVATLRELYAGYRIELSDLRGATADTRA